MNQDEVLQLVQSGLPAGCGTSSLVETHISWVILCDKYVYKIKKPLRYSFLDFSTREKRRFFLQEELRLNWRLTFNVYLGLEPVRKEGDAFTLGAGSGEVADHALCMRRLDDMRRMDLLARSGNVAAEDIHALAVRLAKFHRRTRVVNAADPLGIRERFNDIATERAFVNEMLGPELGDLIARSVERSDRFVSDHETMLAERVQQGWYRDGHGDLHTRNIFLLPEPVIFDCIEFNAAYREIDVLNEIAFLIMDLEALDSPHLAALFVEAYCDQYPMKLSREAVALLGYYKGYRANVRAKVNCLRARSTEGKERQVALRESERYLKWMDRYLQEL